MKYKIEFQYKPLDEARPSDECQELDISAGDGQAFAVPAVGDSIYLKWGEKGQNFKVLTRHFLYGPGFCIVCIAVTDIDDKEMASRLKS